MTSVKTKIITAVIALILVAGVAVGLSYLGINWNKIVAGGKLYTNAELLAARDNGYADGAGSVAEYTAEIGRLNEQILHERKLAEERYQALLDAYQAEAMRLNGEIGRLESLVDLMYDTVYEFFGFDPENLPQTPDVLNLQLNFMNAMKENAEKSIERETVTLSNLPDLTAEKNKLDELIISAAAAEEEIRVTEILRKYALENYPSGYKPRHYDVSFTHGTMERYTYVGDTPLYVLRELGLTTFIYNGKQYSTFIHAYNGVFDYTSNARSSATYLIESIWDGYYWHHGGRLEDNWILDNEMLFSNEYLPILNYYTSAGYIEDRTVIAERDAQQAIYDAYFKQQTISQFLIDTYTDNLNGYTDSNGFYHTGINEYIEDLENALAEVSA